VLQVKWNDSMGELSSFTEEFCGEEGVRVRVRVRVRAKVRVRVRGEG
jgi:hypothetical protein